MLTPAGESDTATATLGIGAALVTIARCAGLPAIGALPWTGTAIFTRRQRRGQCVDRCDER